MIKVKFLGLRLNRIVDFFHAYKLELETITLKEKISLAKNLSSSGIKVLSSKKDKTLIRKRYKTCLKCMIFEYETKICRYENLGCGCYTPYKVLFNKKGEPCWGRARNKKEGWD